VFALMGAVCVAELAAMLPVAGGFRVYARRAFGEGVGFCVGGADWLCCVAGSALGAVTVARFAGGLWPALLEAPRALAVGMVAGIAALHWVGVRVGAAITYGVSAAIGVAMLVLVAACFAAHGAAPMAVAQAGPTGMLLDPARNLPRGIIGGTALVIGLYLLINAALLHVLPFGVLAGADFPGAAAARIALPVGGAALITGISVLTLLSGLNGNTLQSTRVLFGVVRDAAPGHRASAVSAGGTPRAALALSAATMVVLILTGSFEQLVALAAVLFLVCYVSAFAAILVLRVRAPGAVRPYRAALYPVPAVVGLAGSVGLLGAAVVQDPRSGVIAGVFLAACVPGYFAVTRWGAGRLKERSWRRGMPPEQR
jgi:APA family basic amino acid/polyamine antiporter